jgi:hypothetical protein
MPQFVYPSVGLFWLLWVILLWTFVCKLFCAPVLISLGFIYRSGIAGWCATDFEELLYCSPKQLHILYTPKGFNCFMFFPAFVIINYLVKHPKQPEFLLGMEKPNSRKISRVW